MEKGYGFAAEGDRKTAALVRAMEIMGSGLPGGTSFMADYTYHLDPANPRRLFPAGNEKYLKLLHTSAPVMMLAAIKKNLTSGK